MPAVEALQLKLFTSLKDTRTPLAVIDPDVLLLPPLMLVLLLELQAYPPRYNEIAPPYTCTNNSRHSASHEYRQFDPAGADPRALTLEPAGRLGPSARGAGVRSGKFKQAGNAKTYD